MDDHRSLSGNIYTVSLPHDREIVVYGKDTADLRDPDHHVHSSFAFVHQTHGTDLWKHDTMTPLVGKQPIDADAICTWGGPVGVYVADCLPVSIVSEHMSALVHCSWKTLYQGLLQKVLHEFSSHQSGISSVRCGPCIKHYEVGKEFAAYFPSAFLKPWGEKYLFDLVGYVTHQLTAADVDRSCIHIDPGCTRHDSGTYRSYRRGNNGHHNFIGLHKRSSS